MNIMVDSPPKGVRLKKAREFVQQAGLKWEENPDTTVSIFSGSDIVATGSRHRGVLKCIAAREDMQGEGLATKVVTELVKNGIENGFPHLFIYTSPKNLASFFDLGFTAVATTADVVLLENITNGIDTYLKNIKDQTPHKGTTGAVVVNCNPFTKGHLHLIETALAECDYLYIFVLSEDVSEFPFEDRLRLVNQGTAHLRNISIHPTNNYLVSYATFPQYFLQKEENVTEVYSEIDIKIFAERFAKILDINKRFVGTEPLSPVTNAYNKAMAKRLADYGIELVEFKRKESAGVPISASAVRKYYHENRLDEIKDFLPESTYDYLLSRGKNG